MARKIKELLEWLAQFPAHWEVWGYEGEIAGIVVENPDTHEDYSWKNGSDFVSPAAMMYPQKVITIDGKKFIVVNYRDDNLE